MRTLVVDNHDSFVHTLVGYLRRLGADVTVVESDAASAAAFDEMLTRFDTALLSPGPGRPEDAGASVDIVRAAAARGIALLGVCLGHQAIAVAFGGEVTEAPELRHGMASDAVHDGTGVFDGIRSPLRVGRYHSLAVAENSLPAELRVTARTRSGTIMALVHRSLPIHGVQFHPESVLTGSGFRLLANWLAMAGDKGAVAASAALEAYSSPVQ